LVLQRQLVEAFIDTDRLLQGRELRQLGDELVVLLWVERILILKLSDEQLQKCILTEGLVATRAEGLREGAGP